MAQHILVIDDDVEKQWATKSKETLNIFLPLIRNEGRERIFFPSEGYFPSR